jgi:hypothetical protein
MVCVVQWNIVTIVLAIVVLVLQPNIVGTMYVIMEKHVIHVEQIVQNAHKSVEMVSVLVQKVV